MSNIHWVMGMDTRCPYPRKYYPRIPYYIHNRTTDTKFYRTHIQWIIIRDYLTIPVPITIPTLYHLLSIILVNGADFVMVQHNIL